MRFIQNADRAMQIAFGGMDSYIALFEGTVLGANVRHAALFNPLASGVTLQVLDIRPINEQIAGVTGTVEQFDVKRITAAPTGGTGIVPVKLDTRALSIPGSLVFQRGATGGATETDRMFLYDIGTDEVTTSTGGQTADAPYMPNGVYIQPFACNPGEGALVKQITAGTVGTVGWMVVFALLTDNIITNN